jgi:hypothetical protein
MIQQLIIHHEMLACIFFIKLEAIAAAKPLSTHVGIDIDGLRITGQHDKRRSMNTDKGHLSLGHIYLKIR